MAFRSGYRRFVARGADKLVILLCHIHFSDLRTYVCFESLVLLMVFNNMQERRFELLVQAWKARVLRQTDTTPAFADEGIPTPETVTLELARLQG